MPVQMSEKLQSEVYPNQESKYGKKNLMQNTNV